MKHCLANSKIEHYNSKCGVVTQKSTRAAKINKEKTSLIFTARSVLKKEKKNACWVSTEKNGDTDRSVTYATNLKCNP